QPFRSTIARASRTGLPCRTRSSQNSCSPSGAGGVLLRASSTLDDGHDRLDLFPDGGPHFVTGVVHLGPILLPHIPYLGLLLVGQPQVLQTCDPARRAVAHALLAFVLQLRELGLLLLAEHVPDLFHLFPHESADILADGGQLLFLAVVQRKGFKEFLALLS